jgi:two-component system alkaline phosphatase synthesis response regulator PhoP
MIDDKQIKILIVDDDSFLRDMYKVKFESNGFSVVLVSNGTDALSKLREGLEPDVILLDIIMPTMDGLELLKELNKENLIKKSVVVMLTNQAESEEESMKLGAKGFIVKAMAIPSEVVERVTDIYKKNNKK